MPRIDTKFSLEGIEFTAGYLTTSAAIEIATEVQLVILPALGRALPKSGKLSDILTAELSSVDLGGALETLAKALSPRSMQSLIARLCSVVICPEGVLEGAQFEEFFKGRPGLALRVASKSFEVNCGDFFGSAVSLVGLTKK